jgi:vanillate O-demethylase ferredoxin subunit
VPAEVIVSTQRLTVRVARKHVAAVDICTLELVSTDGSALPAFAAGSHVDVHLPGGLVRQYSLCNPPTERHRYLIGVLKDPATRGGSRAVHEQLHEGDLLDISTPRNHFALHAGAAHHLLLAGGIGVTPILCMAEQLALDGEAFEMHYCSRSRERMAFHARIAAAAFAAQVHLHFDDGPPAQKLDLERLLGVPQPGVHLYVCGPKGYMDWVLGTARARGWPAAQLHYEFFAAELVKSDEDGSFEVQLAKSARIVVVPKEKTVVEALADAGVEVPVSCEQGVCGTCLTRVLDGEPDHRDLFLTPEEQAANDRFTPCCSRAKTARLVLDL